MLGAIAGVIGAIVQAQAQAAAIESQERIAKENLKFQKQQAGRQEDLLTADKTDALGNRLTYSELGGFETILAPVVQAIVDANKEEQYRSLKLDAPRNRAARERQDDRTKLADDAYTKAFEDYNKRERVDEGAAVRDAMEQATRLFQAPTAGAGDAAAVQAIRQGTPQLAAQVAGGGPRQNIAGTLAAAIAEAKRSAKTQALAEDNAADAVDLQRLGGLMALANQAPQAQLLYSNDNEEHRARADAAVSALQNIIAQNAATIGNVKRDQMQIAGQVPDYMSIFKSLGQVLNGIPKGDSKAAQAAAAEQQAYERQAAQQAYALDAMGTYGRFQDTMTPDDYLATLDMFGG